MTLRRTDDGTIVLEGFCSIEEAEALLQLLSATPGAPVDWRSCESAHAAIIQILMAARSVDLVGPPRDGFLSRFVAPALVRSSDAKPFPAPAMVSQSKQEPTRGFAGGTSEK